MKTEWRFAGWLAIVLAAASSAWSATVTWDGGGGTLSWQNATNWSSDVLPGNSDDAVINIGSSVTVTSSASVTILSLQCSNSLNLAGGTFRVTSGNSVVLGQLSAGGSPTLAVSGLATRFAVAGAVTANAASFDASGGATISLPNLISYSAGFVCATVSWTATGAGSVLDFPGLTNLTGNACAFLDVQALSGGSVLLTNLPTVSNGNLSILADGTNSLVNLPVVAETMAAVRPVTLEARAGGTVWVPQLKRGPMLTVTLKPGGTLPVAQMELLGGVSVSGMTVSFPALTNFTAGNFNVSSGGIVSVPNLTTYSKGSQCSPSSWTVSGSNSVLELPGLTNVTGGSCTLLTVTAASGGMVLLTNLATVTEGHLLFIADGTNSLVDVGALQQSLATLRPVAFEARNGGTMSLPQLPGGPMVVVTIKSGGTLPVSQLRILNAITISDSAVTFPGLTNINAGSITVNNGAVVSIPFLASYTQGSSCAGDSWTVSGANSVLHLPALTQLSGGACTYLTVEALSGGTIVLTNITTAGEGNLEFLADGTGSLVDLSALQQTSATLRPVTFEARNNGTILAPLFQGGPTVGVTLKSGGTLSAALMQSLNAISVSQTAVTFPALTNLNKASITVNTESVVTLPNLTAYQHGSSCASDSWTVSGSNSVLNLPGLTQLTGGDCTFLTIQALSGGTILLTNVTVLNEGNLALLADGTNSLVDLGLLQQSPGTLRQISLEARNAGTLWTPLLPGGPNVGVTLKSGGVLPVAQMGRLNNVHANGMTVAFTSLTNFDSGTFLVTNAATVTAPALRNHVHADACFADSWVVGGAGSVLDLSGLHQLTGATCGALDVQALGGGHMLLGNLTNILSGTVYFLASGAGSYIDLHSLINYLNPQALSRLSATNSGTFLLNQQPFLLSGVTVNLSAGTPGLPQTTLASTNLVLHGNAWHSYWIEKRNPASPLNPWNFLRRVPLTNDFQVVGLVAPANTEFRVWEFVADPFALELTAVPAGVDVVLYGPTNHTFEVQATTNAATALPWPVIHTATMTNTFRILPREPLSTPHRFFKVNEL